jgi:hypothetical protein
MKRMYSILLALAITAVPVAYAQHGGGHGGGGGMGGGMGMGNMNSGHGNSMDTHGNSTSSHGNSSSTSSGQKTPGQLLTQNTKLASKLQALLPAGTDLQTAASGFKNLGQFVAAVHVSHNLGIPFDQLKAKMQGPPAESLGKAIQQLKPTADSKTETKKATKEADTDIKDSQKS